MQKVDLNNSSDRKKLIWAVGLGLVAIVFLWWTFFGFGSSTLPSNRPTTRVQTLSNQPQLTQNNPSSAVTVENDLPNLHPVVYEPMYPPATEPRRNIFVYYEPPPAPVKVAEAPPATPTPTPPVLLVAVTPANVYARTADFTLDVTGDKFTPNLRVVFDGRELPTRYVSPQQIATTVPAALIANAGSKQVVLRSPDGRSYSNESTLNVSQPPAPNYNYVGIIGTKRFVDTAILQDRNSKETLNVQRGDVLAGRFRVTSISEKELVLTDTTLKIRHSVARTEENEKGYNPTQRPTPKVDAEDDEP
jgi:IPT/TIG domain